MGMGPQLRAVARAVRFEEEPSARRVEVVAAVTALGEGVRQVVVAEALVSERQERAPALPGRLAGRVLGAQERRALEAWERVVSGQGAGEALRRGFGRTRFYRLVAILARGCSGCLSGPLLPQGLPQRRSECAFLRHSWLIPSRLSEARVCCVAESFPQ